MARWIVRETVTLLYYVEAAESEADAIRQVKDNLSVREFDEVDCSPRDTAYKLAAELDTEQD